MYLRIPSLTRLFQPRAALRRRGEGGGGTHVTLSETLVQQGAAEVPGVAELVEIVGAADGTTSDNHGNGVTLDEGGAYSSHTPGAGWSAGTPGSTMQFTCDTYGPKDSAFDTGGGTVTVITPGSDGFAGEYEQHAIASSPGLPTAGTWKPISTGAAIAFDATPVGIAAAINAVLGEGAVAMNTGDKLSESNVQVDWQEVGDQADDALSPVSFLNL